VGALQHARELVVEGLAVQQAGQGIAFAVVEQVLEIAVDGDDAGHVADGVAAEGLVVAQFEAGVGFVAEPDRQP
jgi:hypothetical protein